MKEKDLSSKIEIIREFVAHRKVKVFVEACDIDTSTLWKVLNWGKLWAKLYYRIFMGMNKLVTQDQELLTEFGTKWK